VANEVAVEEFLARPAIHVAAALLAQNQPSLLGQTISHYEILALLGVGGMGEVYLAEDTRLGRRVALKVLPLEAVDKGQPLQRFEQEARAASALNHPNILTVYEIGTAGEWRYIAAEYVGGENLRESLRRGSFSVLETLDIALQLASALAAAHQAGIIHRDVKPENIILRQDGLVKLLDFGIAKLTERAPESFADDAPTQALVKTSPGMLLGTIAYMSPQQVRGQMVDGRADEWSLGVVLYELLTGRLPFAGETPSDVIAAILMNDPEPITQLNPEVPVELERIVLKTLRKDEDERYQHLRSLLVDLRDLKQEVEFAAKLKRTTTQESFAPPQWRSGEVSRDQQGAISGTFATVPGREPGAAVQRQKKRGVVCCLALLVLALSILSFGYYRYFHTSAASRPIDSIAVMPFQNQIDDAASAYLQDGLTESLINSLSRLPQLRVMARATMFRYKGRTVDPQTAGTELGVRAVVTGRILQQGDNLIISAELVNVADGTQLWGERFNRPATDFLAVQQEIAREIAEQLKLRPSGERVRQLNQGGTDDNEAFKLYLRGRYSWNKRTADELKKAIALFQQAIAKDPNYALAYVGLADCYLLQGTYAGTPTTEVMPQAQAALERALTLDDSLAEAHATRGFVHIYALEWDAAETDFQRAITLNPNYATAHHWYSEYFRIQRRFLEQVREIKRAQELDPLSPSMGANLGRAYLNLGETEAAIKECRRALDLNPNFPLAHHFLGLTYVEQHHYDEAIAEFQQAVNSSKRADLFVAGLGVGYARAGKRAEALELVKELEAKYAKKEATGFDLALVHAALENDDEAMAWLEKDFAGHNMSGLVYVASTIIHQRLHNQPRYQALLAQLHLKL
jgi:serine/threonine-protein kinase